MWHHSGLPCAPKPFNPAPDGSISLGSCHLKNSRERVVPWVLGRTRVQKLLQGHIYRERATLLTTELSVGRSGLAASPARREVRAISE